MTHSNVVQVRVRGGVSDDERSEVRTGTEVVAAERIATVDLQLSSARRVRVADLDQEMQLSE